MTTPLADQLKGLAESEWRLGSQKMLLITPTLRDELIGALDGSVKYAHALRVIARNEIEVFDEDLRATVVVSMDAEEMADLARAALGDVG